MSTVMVTCVAVIALLLAACSSEKSGYVTEMERRGFTDVTLWSQESGGATLYGNAGECRLWIKYTPEDGYTLVEPSTKGEANNLTVVEPTVVKLKQLPELAYCFEQPTSPVPSEGS